MKKEVNVDQPNVIAEYNKFMGGADHLDWLIQKYRIGIAQKNGIFH